MNTSELGFAVEAGYPTADSAQRMFDEFDYQAATQFYIWAYAYLNGSGWDKGLAAMGGDERSIHIFDKRVQPQHVVMTANDQVVYNCTRAIDLSAGPVVIEVPARTRGHFFDIGMRAYVDTGDVGPDQGHGGKYLAMSSDYRGAVPDGYFEVRLEYSDLLLYLTRSFPDAEGGLDAAVDLGKQLKWYPLAEATSPSPNGIVLIGDRAFSQDWPRDAEAFAWLAETFERDKVPASGLAHMGNMRRLGIEVGKPFSPDDRAKAILKRAASTGQAMVLSMAFQNRQDGLIYDDRQYERPFFNEHSQFFADTYEEVEVRAGSWHQLVGNFVSVVPAEPGTGQFGMLAYRDSDGNNFDGANTYRLRIPPEPPVAQFWQIPVYEVKTRSLINTDQKRPTRSSTDALDENTDGSVDLYFGPEPPEGFERNWIKTIPGEGWFALPRLYGPLEPILAKEWRLDDIELMSTE
jgi:hypothetical protein